MEKYPLTCELRGKRVYSNMYLLHAPLVTHQRINVLVLALSFSNTYLTLGKYVATIFYFGKEISGSPITIEASSPQRTIDHRATGLGLQKALCNKDAFFTIYPKGQG
eukprot:TRINITY_DN5814_c0_g1_i1.p1 TRINITY_DN5814_c0_g1~~TRINITY_DN5814_c0_g1_i1.p1  ORF type:complete len:107 (+),score=4.88 TRINITY_DN5814_c0_g1_i1:118-438(+)